MIEIVVWGGFLGSWLLVTGSVFQAALELSEAAGQGRASRDELYALATPPPPTSPWWWLIPPVYYALNAARSKRYREMIMTKMDPDALRSMVTFGRKATGWLVVALGAFVVAIKETAELAEHHELPIEGFAALIVIMPLLAFSYTAANLRRFERYLRIHDASRSAGELSR